MLMFCRPEELVVACNGSPMVIGLGTDHIYVASETAAFNRHTKNFIAMQDGEIAVITPTECSLDKARMELVSPFFGFLGPFCLFI